MLARNVYAASKQAKRCGNQQNSTHFVLETVTRLLSVLGAQRDCELAAFGSNHDRHCVLQAPLGPLAAV